MKKRLDLLLVEKGLAASREKAKAIIMSGVVLLTAAGRIKPELHLTKMWLLKSAARRCRM